MKEVSFRDEARPSLRPCVSTLLRLGYVTQSFVDTCLGTDADLTAALRKSLSAGAHGAAVDSPLATIVTAFAVIFHNEK